jgi:hypothetical protein
MIGHLSLIPQIPCISNSLKGGSQGQARSYPAPSGITPPLFAVHINKRVDFFRSQHRGEVGCAHNSLPAPKQLEG